MNYYYALLESYDLLKKRKFKLSLREQDEDPEAQAKAYVSQAGGTEGGIKTGIDVTSPDGQMGKVWKATRSGKINFADNEEGQFYDAVTPGTGAGWDKLVSFLSGKKEGQDQPDPAGGGDEEGGEDTAASPEGAAPGPEDPLVAPLLQQRDLAIEGLDKLEELQSPNFTAEKTEKLRELLDGLGENPTQDEIDSVTSLNDFLHLQKTILEDQDGAREGKYVHAINSFWQENAIEVNQYGVKFGSMWFETTLMQDKDGDGRITAEELAQEGPITGAIERLDQLQADNEGELGQGSAAQRAPRVDISDSGTETTFRGSSAEFLAEATGAYRDYLNASTEEEQRVAGEKLFEKIAQARQMTDLIGPDGKPICRKDDAGNDIMGPTVPGKKPKCDTVKVVALDTAQVLQMFAKGSGIREGVMLSDDKGIRDAAAVWFIARRLRRSGLSRDKVRELLERATENDGLAIAIILATNRQWEEDYMGDFIPTTTKAVGGGGEIGGKEEKMTDQGAKADMVDTFCKSPQGKPYKAKELKAHFESLLSDKQKAHYAKACGGDGAGIDELVREAPVDPAKPDGEKCLEVDRELKVFSNKKGAKHKLGQIGIASVRRACNGGTDPAVTAKGKEDSNKWTANSLKFLDKVKDRLDKCGQKDVFQGMCDYQDKIDKEAKDFDTVLNKPIVSVKHAKEALQIFSDNSSLNAKGRMRVAAAQYAIDRTLPKGGSLEAIKAEAAKKKKKDGTPYTIDEYCDYQLGKVKSKLTGAIMLEELNKDTDSSRVVKRGSKAEKYLIGQYAITGGSDRECVKQKRHLEDGTQSISLNNAEVQANMKALQDGTGRIRRSTGLGTKLYLEVRATDDKGKLVEPPKWEKRAEGDTASKPSSVVWENTHTISQGIDKPGEEGFDAGTQNPANQPADESLFKTFLTGQQKLLEKLISQTT
tara:strand:+ start:12537 stop:15332 length:2796 start_codon:yes stop_codon:yes gene_type:complete